MESRTLANQPGERSRRFFITLTSASSSSLEGLGIFEASASTFAPSRMYIVASPPSSRIMLATSPFGQSKIRSTYSQYSSSVSPFSAKTGVPAAAIAAAAWSCVEKMLHEAQRTSAPSAFSVSISTAVWIVMCRQPAMRAPFSGCDGAVLLAGRHEAGHLGLGDLDLLAAPAGEREVLHLRICRHPVLVPVAGAMPI